MSGHWNHVLAEREPLTLYIANDCKVNSTDRQSLENITVRIHNGYCHTRKIDVVEGDDGAFEDGLVKGGIDSNVNIEKGRIHGIGRSSDGTAAGSFLGNGQADAHKGSAEEETGLCPSPVPDEADTGFQLRKYLEVTHSILLVATIF